MNEMSNIVPLRQLAAVAGKAPHFVLT